MYALAIGVKKVSNINSFQIYCVVLAQLLQVVVDDEVDILKSGKI